ncbi:MAG: alanine:cation symporter family protein [Acutalibacteraceae bacterium]
MQRYLGWAHIGAKALEYLLKEKGVTAYKFIFTLFIVLGAVANLELAWSISDTFNGLMAVPNLIGLILLSGTVVKITDNFIKRTAKKGSKNIKPMLSAFEDIQAEAERKKL